jgi:hypothetical protein
MDSHVPVELHHQVLCTYSPLLLRCRDVDLAGGGLHLQLPQLVPLLQLQLHLLLPDRDALYAGVVISEEYFKPFS